MLRPSDIEILEFLREINIPGYLRVLIWLDAYDGKLVIPKRLPRKKYKVGWRDIQTLEDLGLIVVGRDNYTARLELTANGWEQLKRLKHALGLDPELIAATSADCAKACEQRHDIASCVKECVYKVYCKLEGGC